MLRGTYFDRHLTINYNYYVDRVKYIESNIHSNLRDIMNTYEYRINGLFFAWDLSSTHRRDDLVHTLYKNNILCNPTGRTSIRF